MSYLTDQQVIDKLYESDIEPVILNYLNFTFYIADRVARRSWTHEAKDIRCEALLALVEGVNQLKGKINTNPKALLGQKIRGAVLNYVMRQHTIYTPQGKAIDEKWQYIEDIEKEWSNSASIPEKLWEHFDKQGSLVARSLYESFLFSGIEKKIIKMRIEGWTLEEIALECKLPYVQAQRILQGTKNRVERIIDGDY